MFKSVLRDKKNNQIKKNTYVGFWYIFLIYSSTSFFQKMFL